MKKTPRPNLTLVKPAEPAVVKPSEVADEAFRRHLVETSPSTWSTTIVSCSLTLDPPEWLVVAEVLGADEDGNGAPQRHEMRVALPSDVPPYSFDLRPILERARAGWPIQTTALDLVRSDVSDYLCTLLDLDEEGRPLGHDDAASYWSEFGVMRLVAHLGITATSSDEELAALADLEERKARKGIAILIGTKRFFWGLRAALIEMARHPHPFESAEGGISGDLDL